MIVYNLTDYDLPYRKSSRKPRKLKVAGVEIEPGKFADIPDHRLQPSDIAGWITASEISIDGLPKWYQEARRQKMDRKSAQLPVPNPKLEGKKPKSGKKSRSKSS